MILSAETTPCHCKRSETIQLGLPRRTPAVHNFDDIDRLAHAQNFANELNDSRLRKKAQNRWSAGQRAAQALHISRQRPWKHATGPQTAAGKAVSALNSYKHGLRSRRYAELGRLMRAQSWYVRWLGAHHGFKNLCSDNALVLQTRLMKLHEILLKTRQAFEAAGIDTAPLDARLIVRQGGNFSDSDLITGGQTPLSAEVIEKIENFAIRRIAGEPVSRLSGGREFWGLDFKISPDTLDPRPDTETLVEAALKWARERGQKPLRILDLGTGSGCILISLLRELPHATGVGIDINPGALAISRENALRLEVADRAEFRQGSWWEGVSGGESFDLVVSNPPYIPHAEIESLAPEVRNHDPIQALSGGEDGLDAYKIILHDLKKRLVCGGRALFEIGRGQEKSLARLVDESNMYVCDSYPDLGGILRVVEISHGEK